MTIFGVRMTARDFLRGLAEFAVFFAAMCALCAWLVIINDFIHGA